MLVVDRATVTTGQTQQGSGAGTANQADVALGVTDGTKFAVGEVLTLGTERMLVVDVVGNVLTVKRGWDGTVLATHSGATIYASRLLTVVRGALGTTAAAHLISTAAARHLVPPLAKTLTIAEAMVTQLQMTSGYAASVGSGAGKVTGLGMGLNGLRAQAAQLLGRKTRIGVV